jgi:hypothetical protein
VGLPLPSPDVDNMCGQGVQETLGNTNLGFFGGWADGWGVYWPRKRSSWIANALENFAARPSPSLCEIRKAASISSFGLTLAISRFSNSLG